MKKLLSTHRNFFLPYTIFLIAGFIAMIAVPKGTFTIWLNQHRTSAYDFFFYYITEVGQGWIFAIASFIFLFIRYGVALMIAVAGILTALLSALFKLALFPDAARPPTYFEGKYQLHFIPNVATYYSHSFPSGHTMVAFSFFTLISFIIRNKNWDTVFFFIAFAIGISRIYLLKHFFDDVYAGSIMGVVIAIMVFLYFEKRSEKWRWMNGKLRFRTKNGFDH